MTHGTRTWSLEHVAGTVVQIVDSGTSRFTNHLPNSPKQARLRPPKAKSVLLSLETDYAIRRSIGPTHDAQKVNFMALSCLFVLLSCQGFHVVAVS